MSTYKTFRDFVDESPKVGDKVLVNGLFEGTIVKLHTDERAGMVDVKLPRGLVTVSIKDLQ